MGETQALEFRRRRLSRELGGDAFVYLQLPQPNAIDNDAIEQAAQVLFEFVFSRTDRLDQKTVVDVRRGNKGRLQGRGQDGDRRGLAPSCDLKFP